MSNKTYITDDHNLNDSSIAASSKAISNGLSALMDNIIVAANAAANSQTTIPNNNAVELSNRIEQVAAKNIEQDAAISAAQSSADNALAQAGEFIEVLDGKMDKAGGDGFTLSEGAYIAQNPAGQAGNHEVTFGFPNGGRVILRREDSEFAGQYGMAALRAKDTTKESFFLVYPDGKIVLNEKTVLIQPDYGRQIYGSVGANTFVTASETSLVICWGAFNNTTGHFTLYDPNDEIYAVGYCTDDNPAYTTGHSQTFICPAGWRFKADQVGFEYRIYPMTIKV